jgi:hypothetical protein
MCEEYSLLGPVSDSLRNGQTSTPKLVSCEDPQHKSIKLGDGVNDNLTVLYLSELTMMLSKGQGISGVADTFKTMAGIVNPCESVNLDSVSIHYLDEHESTCHRAWEGIPTWYHQREC